LPFWFSFRSSSLLVEASAALRTERRISRCPHIYRIVGSVQDAEDLLQETLLAAWRGLEQFQERASIRAWLYRIATNRSLDALRRERPARLRVLPAECADRRRAAVLAVRPHAGGRPDIRDHLVRRSGVFPHFGLPRMLR
jgi:DNA-directed RNA polymerase specialized sigma24 family protein